jgi:serine/threonine-protein kinase
VTKPLQAVQKPAPSPPAPPAYGPPPYQNQPYYPGSHPPQPINPRKRDRGTLPAIPVAAPIGALANLAVTPQMPGVVPQAPPTPGPARPATIPVSQTGSFATPPVQPVPAQASAPRIMVHYPQEGSKLAGARGTYEVRSVLGSGEFGAVYDCIGPFDQAYAVKMVRPANRPYSEVHAEWSKEVQRLFSLRHPNVVYIYDSFTQDHLFYLALERCDHPLKSMLGTPMQEGLVLEISRQLLTAVQFLHDNDVVHDDLHAGNVLITHTDRPTVKISDFGISHELRGMNAVRPNIVHHAIMAPEILAHGFTSRQSDLYQVGLLLYWMVTGESAIQLEVPYQELVRLVAEGEPRQRAEAIGTPLGMLIAKMLRRREAFRFSSAREVWAEMRELDAWKQRDLFPTK